jgi:ribonucleoside-diphosphate reductase alpha chain
VLKTFGGRASGPEPLDKLFRFLVTTFKGAMGRKLNSIECHDIICKIADSVVAGGVRRSACISLSNLSDDRMARAKQGQWWIDNGQRALANNSVAYTERPDFDSFFKELRNLHRSKSGERGIINRVAFKRKAEACGRDSNWEFGANPCGEIILRPNQFCNLSEVVVRSDDTLDSLKRKVELATILGTLQATLTDFRYLRKVWRNNTEEERLLGVSLTGIMDHDVLSGEYEKLVQQELLGTDIDVDDLGTYQHLPTWLQELKEVAYETNREWASKLGIEPAASITCVKPSGTVSQLVDSSSGIHPRMFGSYIRTTTDSKNDPIAKFLVEQGVPHNEDDRNFYFQFPMKSPEGSVVADQMGAMEQLKLWKIYQDSWCDHNPSQTIYYTDDEFLEVGSWVWKNFDSIGGLSFFPKSDHVYENAPFQEVTNEEVEHLIDNFPVIDWDGFRGYEVGDNTSGSQEFACSGGKCEL